MFSHDTAQLVVNILVYFVTLIVVLGGHLTNDGHFLARNLTDSPEPTQTNIHKRGLCRHIMINVS